MVQNLKELQTKWEVVLLRDSWHIQLFGNFGKCLRLVKFCV